MHQSVGKITYKLCYFHHKQKCAQQKAAIISFNADNHVISLSCGKKNLHTSVPISYFETLLLFYLFVFFNIRYEQNYDISHVLKCFRRGAVFLISVKWARERSGKWWSRSGAGAEWLLNARSAGANYWCSTPLTYSAWEAFTSHFRFGNSYLR